MDNHVYSNTINILDQILPNGGMKNQGDHEYIAFLLINEMNQNNKVSRLELLDQLIGDECLSEEYCQRLLSFKIKHLIELNQFENALAHLEQLDNPNYRLTCNTYQYFQLLFLRSQIYIIQKNFNSAFASLQNICNLDFFSEEYLSLSKHQELLKEWYRQSAIAAHFCNLDCSYTLFQRLINSPECTYILNASNINVFVIFANECIRQKKYLEASNLFLKLVNFMDEQSHLIHEDLKLEIMSLNIIAQKLKSPSQLISEIDYSKFKNLLSICSNSLSEKNQKLKINVMVLTKNECKSYNKVYLPRMHYANEVRQLHLAGANSLAGPNVNGAGESPVASWDMDRVTDTDVGIKKVHFFNHL